MREKTGVLKALNVSFIIYAWEKHSASKKFSIFALCFEKREFMWRNFVLVLVSVLSAIPVFAATREDVSSSTAAGSEDKENKKTDFRINIALDTRLDGQVTAYSGTPEKSTELGFAGKFITLVVDGSITENLTYGYRQRLFTKDLNPTSFFNATDWLYLKYRFHKNFTFTAGKDVIAIGGFEYDMNPIDVYFYSMYCNNVTCYQLGLSLTYMDNKGNHSLKAQVTNSPFSTGAYDGKFAYNLLWSGNMGWFKTLYSVNMVERERGHFLNYIALGNRFTWNPVTIDLDYTNRYAVGGSQRGFFSDFSLTCMVTCTISKKFNIFLKGGYDRNLGQAADTEDPYDPMVVPGSKYFIYGAGVEFFPIKDKKDLRVHAFWYSDNSKPVPNTFNIGVRWRIKVFQSDKS